ncbi:hypothetical protein [Halorubrum lipolyticum]|uniref:Uncharacterized protein n=1 Tax=Halorubrum lipolyticum DSM 21995 TaxID=1227482 RepID=M0NVR3_9EURY|nr:hypothetical protein [Halorubrum lipolyticum]EMA61354.1 hypothetical protein C469_06641 [Halorubrum lipolyticum DSM 21995]
MSSTTGSHDTLDGTDGGAVDSVDGPWLRSTASAGTRPKSERYPGCHHRVRVAALTAEVEALEAEVEALEQIVESKERQRQQLIDNYETIVAARSEADDAADAESDASDETERWRLRAAVASRLERAAAWVRRSDE